MSARLSFIIPIYKPDVLVFEKCVKSLVEQAFKDWEAIFVLDGHWPEAREVIGKYVGRFPGRMEVIEIEHGGACKARNEGFKHSLGEFVVFWDCDCAIEPAASRMWVQVFDKKPEAGFIYSGYKFFGDQHAIPSEAWDPYLLRVRNFISTCFPLRRALFPGFCEDLKSLQDWDMWLSVLDKAENEGLDTTKLGYFVEGFAFSTPLPSGDSISAKGCTADVWLERMDAVKKRHNLPWKDTCVSSLGYKHEGVRLAKLINADYQDFPNDKPHKYTKIIQIGFSLDYKRVEKHAAIFQEKGVKKFLFWTSDDINEIYNGVSFRTIRTYNQILNDICTQFVEDKSAQEHMEAAGFKVKILPMPIENKSEIKPPPEKPKFAVDIQGVYGNCMVAVEKSLPDVELEVVNGTQPITDYTGLIHFFGDKTLSNSIKRSLLTGRYVVSNVQSPFCGHVDDKENEEKIVTGIVKGVRSCLGKGPNMAAVEYYKKALGPEPLKEILCV